MKLPVEEVNGARRLLDLGEGARAAVRLASIVVAVALLVSCGGAERRAERLFREADRLAAKGEPAAAVASLERILRDYPRTEAAGRARDKVELYRGLADAVARFPQRRAREVVVAVARAVEQYRAARGAPPDTLAQMVPDFLDAVTPDPWGGALLYERDGPGSYRLASLGADGVRGGDGDRADIVVVNGRFAEDVQP